MKKLAVICGLVVMAAMGVRAEFNEAITNWIADYQYIAPTNTDVGTTGVATGTAYVCFPVAALADVSTNQADEAGGDIRALFFGVPAYFKTLWDATASSNRPTKVVMSEGTEAESRTNMTVSITIQADLSGTTMAVEDE